MTELGLACSFAAIAISLFTVVRNVRLVREVRAMADRSEALADECEARTREVLLRRGVNLNGARATRWDLIDAGLLPKPPSEVPPS